jgi:hypothetical protein
MAEIDLKFDGAKDVSQPVNLTFYPEGWNAAGVNLVFSEALDTSHPVKLKFGTGGTEEPETVNANLSLIAVVPAPSLSGTIGHSQVLALDATVPAPTLSAVLFKTREVQMGASIPAPVLSVSLVYDNAVYRGPNGVAHAGWQVADKAHGATEIGFQSTKPLPSGMESLFQDAQKLQSIAQMPWQSNLSTRTNALSRFQDGIKIGTVTTDHQANMLRLRNSSAAPWQDGVKVVADNHTGWQDRFRYPRPELASRWAEAKNAGIDRSTTAGAGKSLQALKASHWQPARKPPAGTYTWGTPIVPPDVCYHPPLGNDVPLLFQDVFSSDADLLFYCASKRDTPAAVLVPIKRTYIVLNDVHLIRVDGNLELPATALSLNIDMDSWTWGFTAAMPASALSLVEPGMSGDPVLLKASINGNHYLLLAESITRDRTFGKSSISVSGRGQSAMLADPYSPILTFANAGDRTAQQLMNDALTTNGVSLGWAIDWRIDDWLVPAGVWSHQGSYMSAINAIAAAAGAFIQPDPVLKTLRVRPRYPHKPWEWYGAGVIPDIELPAAAVVKEAIAWTEKPAYNAVFVSGTTAGGILGHVTRAGTAGDVMAPMITDALITQAAAARQRGTNVLADTGRGATYSLSLPVLAETGIIDPGTLVRYVDNGNPTIGVVKGVSVNASLPSVRQTIEVQAHG